MVVEVDAMPGGYVCSASFKGSIGPGDAVKRVAAGDRAIRKLFSKQQRPSTRPMPLKASAWTA